MPLDFPASPANDALILSPRANRVRLARGEEGVWRLEEAPPWLLDGVLDLRPKLPLPLRRGHPLWPLAAVARDLAEERERLSNYLLEFARHGEDGQQPLSVMLEGAPQGPAAVELTAHDVTEAKRHRRRAVGIGAYHGLVGQSHAMLEVYQKISLYAPTEAPVLITGETGTGKELVAKAVHERSERADGPFVPVNCSALSDELFESEFFGHERGSFTGAHRQHKGRFERADGGTLFLDEVGDMPLMAQAKLLRALEEGIVERVGSESEIRVDVRIVAATNVALESGVAARRFRADLYHRLSVLRIHLPALRERRGDLPLLADGFLKQYAGKYRRPVRAFTPDALRLMETYPWPGNVRELRNCVERLVVETLGDAVGGQAVARWIEERRVLGGLDASPPPTHQPPSRVFFAGQEGIAPPAPGARYGDAHWGRPVAALPHHDPGAAPIDRPAMRQLRQQKPELTEDTIREAFASAAGNATAAAEMLGVHKATLYRAMKKLGISREDLEEPT
ncbi:MAG: sigma-54 dependent transcriptional regulator [Sumerlaeia bacterium]